MRYHLAKGRCEVTLACFSRDLNWNKLKVPVNPLTQVDETSLPLKSFCMWFKLRRNPPLPPPGWIGRRREQLAGTEARCVVTSCRKAEQTAASVHRRLIKRRSLLSNHNQRARNNKAADLSHGDKTRTEPPFGIFQARRASPLSGPRFLRLPEVRPQQQYPIVCASCEAEPTLTEKAPDAERVARVRWAIEEEKEASPRTLPRASSDL